MTSASPFSPSVSAALAALSQERVSELTTTFLGGPQSLTFDAALVALSDQSTGTIKVGGVDLTAAPDGDKAHAPSRQHLNAALWMLYERQETFGPLFNHPRVLLLGPDVSFGCTSSGNRLNASRWVNVAATLRQTPKPHRPNVDKIIWVNHCHTKPKGNILSAGRSPRAIQINELLLLHGSSVGAQIPLVHRVYTYYDLSGTDTREFAETDYADQRARVWAATARDDEGSKVYPIGENSVTLIVVAEDPSNAPQPQDDADAYVRRAVARLEILTRTRLDDDYKTTPTEASVQAVHRAVLTGHIPIAAADLAPESMQPTVHAGLATLSDLARLHTVLVSTFREQTTGFKVADQLFDYSSSDGNDEDEDENGSGACGDHVPGVSSPVGSMPSMLDESGDESN